MAQAMTEGVYAIDMVKGHRSIVSYKIATVHPLRHLRCHLPLHRGGSASPEVHLSGRLLFKIHL